MQLRFSKEVRRSIADELKKISTYGGIGLGALGYSISDPWIVLSAFIWWILCQVIANTLIALEA